MPRYEPEFLLSEDPKDYSPSITKLETVTVVNVEVDGPQGDNDFTFIMNEQNVAHFMKMLKFSQEQLKALKNKVQDREDKE